MNIENYKQILNELKDEDKISQGAEAIMYRTKIENTDVLIKHRFPKSYREPTLDKTMNKKRVNNENKILQKFNELQIPSPKVYYCQRLDIIMEYIEGKTLKNYINDSYNKEENNYSCECFQVMRKLGNLIATIHKKGYIHGDLTTSNFMIRNETNEIIIIDFGLTSVSETTENRAVDLYVLERALLCTHYDANILFESIINGYCEYFEKSKEIIKHLDEVRLRGRKKDMSG